MCIADEGHIEEIGANGMNMRIDDFTRLQAKLVAEEKLSFPYAAIMTENALYRFDERVREGVILWLDGKLTEEFEVEGYALYEFFKEAKVSMFQALCMLDILLKDPKVLKKAIWGIKADVIRDSYVNVEDAVKAMKEKKQ